MKKPTRFVRFQIAMKQQLGMNCQLLANGGVMIGKNEFSPAQTFHSLQAAIDHFARHMPQDLL
jgi:hypothetical protein